MDDKKDKEAEWGKDKEIDWVLYALGAVTLALTLGAAIALWFS